MTHPSLNLTPGILLAAVTLLFAVTWRHDRIEPGACQPAVVRVESAVARRTGYRAATGVFTSGRAALRGIVARAGVHSPVRNPPRLTGFALAPSVPETRPNPTRVDWLANLIDAAVSTR